jgi:hypothetical protein
MSQIFPYINGAQAANEGLITKGASDFPSFYIDWSDGLISSGTTISSVSAVALSSTGSTVTSNVVGTLAISGAQTRVDLRTGGASSGTDDALNNDRFKLTITCTPSSGGPITYPVYILIDAGSYNVSG